MMKRMMKTPYLTGRGVGLVELLMSMALFTVLSVLSANVMVQQGLMMAKATNISQAAEVGTSILEEAAIIALTNFDDDRIDDNTDDDEPYGYGDLDPTLAMPAEGEFDATYTVMDRRWDGADIDAGHPADHKIVTVTVTWDDFSGDGQVRVFRTVIGR